MPEEIQSVITGGGGGGLPYRPARSRPALPKEPDAAPAGAREGDSAQLSVPPESALRDLVARLEGLQTALLSATDEASRQDLRTRLAVAEVALSNRMGAVGELPSLAFLQTPLLGAVPVPSPARVLRLLGEGTP